MDGPENDRRVARFRELSTEAPMSNPFEKQHTADSSTSSYELLQQLMKQQETKDPKLAAKQRRVLEILKRDSSTKPPTDSTR